MFLINFLNVLRFAMNIPVEDRESSYIRACSNKGKIHHTAIYEETEGEQNWMFIIFRS
jgi:hypothetical protein